MNVIELDYTDRKLEIEDPTEENPYWKFWLYQFGEERFCFLEIKPDVMLGATRIARDVRSHLYWFCSSTWIDEHFEAEVQPLIINHIREFGLRERKEQA